MALNPRVLIAAFLSLGLVVIGYVLFSQYVEGYLPCELCLRERRVWYVAIGLGAIGVVWPSRRMLGLIGVVLLIGAGLGGHHAGVEQHWWPGPEACTSDARGANTIDELRALLHSAPLVRCDEISWTLFGLSMPVYNFLLSLAAGLTALFLARRVRGDSHAR